MCQHDRNLRIALMRDMGNGKKHGFLADFF